MPMPTDAVLFTGGLMLATAFCALVCSAAAGGVARIRHEGEFGARQDALWRHVCRRTGEIVDGAANQSRAETERLVRQELEPLVAMHVALADFMPESDRRAVESFLVGAMRRNLQAELDRRDAEVSRAMPTAA
jgi:hypothetical protein